MVGKISLNVLIFKMDQASGEVWLSYTLQASTPIMTEPYQRSQLDVSRAHAPSDFRWGPLRYLALFGIPNRTSTHSLES